MIYVSLTSLPIYHRNAIFSISYLNVVWKFYLKIKSCHSFVFNIYWCSALIIQNSFLSTTISSYLNKNLLILFFPVNRIWTSVFVSSYYFEILGLARNSPRTSAVVTILCFSPWQCPEDQEDTAEEFRAAVCKMKPGEVFSNRTSSRHHSLRSQEAYSRRLDWSRTEKENRMSLTSNNLMKVIQVWHYHNIREPWREIPRSQHPDTSRHCRDQTEAFHNTETSLGLKPLEEDKIFWVPEVCN